MIASSYVGLSVIVGGGARDYMTSSNTRHRHTWFLVTRLYTQGYNNQQYFLADVEGNVRKFPTILPYKFNASLRSFGTSNDCAKGNCQAKYVIDHH